MSEFKDFSFIKWAKGREQARKNREAGLPRDKWSDDWILQEYRFCNVSREDDRGTRVVKELIRDPMVRAGADPKELCRAIAVARFFNLPTTIELLRQKEAITETKVDLVAVHRVLTEVVAKGQKIFSPAYLVGCPPGQLVPPFTEAGGKISYVCSIVQRAKWPLMQMDRQGFVKELRREAGFKDFMAGQIVADLAYTPILESAPDHLTWAPFGPGAVRGMNLTMGRPIDYKMTEAEYLRVGIMQLEALPEDIVRDRKLTLHDVASNVNCETFKYIRISKGGTGRRLNKR